MGKNDTMHNHADNHHGAEGAIIRLCLPATVDNFHLASILTPLLENQQYRVSLDASRVTRLGTVEFRALGIFAEACRRQGGFLKLENASVTMAALVREFGCTDLLRATSG
jgi:anti-anti-sigma regulatory factor